MIIDRRRVHPIAICARSPPWTNMSATNGPGYSKADAAAMATSGSTFCRRSAGRLADDRHRPMCRPCAITATTAAPGVAKSGRRPSTSARTVNRADRPRQGQRTAKDLVRCACPYGPHLVGTRSLRSRQAWPFDAHLNRRRAGSRRAGPPILPDRGHAGDRARGRRHDPHGRARRGPSR